MKNNFCIDCGIKISKYSKRCIICRNRFIVNKYIKNKHKSIKFKKLISKLMKKRLKNPKNHPNYKEGISLKKHYCIDCNKEIHHYKTIRCKKCYSIRMKILFKGKNNPAYKDGRTLENKKCFDCGKRISYQNTRCMKCSYMFKSILYKDKNNPNYKHGLGNLPYPLEFNENLKEYIRDRDNYKCQNCNKSQEQELTQIKRKLGIHHIDYNKYNCKENNLITLCLKCNLKANSNRDYWYAYFRYMRGNQ